MTTNIITMDDIIHSTIQTIQDLLARRMRDLESRLRALNANIRDCNVQITNGSNPDRVRQAWLEERDGLEDTVAELQEEYDRVARAYEVMSGGES